MMNTYNHDMVAECIAQWGNADSIALLDPQSLIFSVPHMQGIIGYRTQVGCAVVLADPVCPADTLSSLTMAFHDYCKEHFKTVMYALASERFAQWALHSTCKSALSIGHELIIDPRNDIKAGNGSSVRRLRNKYNHALRSGIIINEYVGNDTNIEQAMEQLREVWLQNRQGMQVQFGNRFIFTSCQ